MRYGYQPDLKHLRTFGCNCYRIMQDDEREGKLDARAKEMIFVGYDVATGLKFGKWRFFNPVSKKFVSGIDVVFDEESFTFAKVYKEVTTTETITMSEMFGEDVYVPPTIPGSVPIYTKTDEDPTPTYVFQDEVVDDVDIIVHWNEEAEPVRGSVVTVDAQDQQLQQTNEIFDANNNASVEERSDETGAQTTSNGTTNMTNDTTNQTQQPATEKVYVTQRGRKSVKPKPFFAAAALVECLNDPQTVEEAMSSPYAEQWSDAVIEEVSHLIGQKTWLIVGKVPKGFRILSTKFVFHLKKNIHLVITKFKSRFVARGCGQRKGFDYFETYSPVVNCDTVRFIFAWSLDHGYVIVHVDVKSAFIQSDLFEEIYISFPKGIEKLTRGLIKEGSFARLLKDLYGLKQAALDFYKTLKRVLGQDCGLIDLGSDQCAMKGNDLLVAFHVDDIIISGPIDKVEQTIQILRGSLTLGEVGPIQKFLNMHIKYEIGRQLSIDQSHVIKEVLNKFGMSNCKPVSTPAIEYERNGEALAAEQQQLYKSLVGSLMYIALSCRPDICYAVNRCGRYFADATAEDLIAAKRILRYLCGTMNYGIVYENEGTSENISMFTDASFASTESRRSVSGCVQIYKGGAIYFKSNNILTV